MHPIVLDEIGENWTKFFFRVRIVFRYILLFCQKYLCPGWNIDLRPAGQILRRLSGQFRIGAAVFKVEQLPETFCFFFCHEVSSACFKFGSYLCCDAAVHDNGLLRCRYDAIVKCLACYDILDCLMDVRRPFNERRPVAGSAVDHRFTGVICILKHTRNACVHDQRSPLVLHQFLRSRFGHGVKVCQRTFWKSAAFGCLDQNVQHSGNGFLCSWMRRKQNAIAGLYSDKSCVDGRGNRTCRRAKAY